MNERILNVRSGPFTLEARLACGPHSDRPVPGAVLLHPWGAWDMDGSLDASLSADGRPIHLFLPLRDALVAAGWAVLRYNSRFAVCGGRQDPRFDQLTFSGLVADARAMVSVLREAPGIDPACIWLVGISLGTEVAMAVAEADPGIAGLVLLAPIGEGYRSRRYYLDVERKLEWLLRSGLVDGQGKVSLRQLREREPERFHWWNLEPELEGDGLLSFEEIAAILKAHHTASVDSLLANGNEEAPAAWWREWMENPPAYSRLQRYAGPVLILVGEDDNTTPPREAYLLIRSVGHRPGVDFRVFPGLGHLFSPRRADESRTYGPLAPEVVSVVADYLKQQVARR